MTAITVQHSTIQRGTRERTQRREAVAVWRLVLVAGTGATVAIAVSLGNPGPFAAADAELAFLMRGMAVIKACIVMPAVGLIFWRLGKIIPPSLATAYVAGAWLLAGATVLIWQLTYIPLAAAAFHIGEFTLLIAAWREWKSHQPKRAA